MSHNKGYSKFYKNPNKIEDIKEKNNEQVTIEDVIETEQLNTLGLNQVINESNNEEIPNEVSTNNKIGSVKNAKAVYVRKEPNKESEPLGVIYENSEVTVDLNETDESSDFYKVITQDNIQGYCMKKFIEIK